MVRLSVLVVTLAGLLAAVGGCQTRRIVPEPGKITIEEAMESVGRGIAKMHEAEGGKTTGLLPAEVEIVFNISASAKDKGGLYVEVAGKPIPQMAGKLTGEAGGMAEAVRGNQIRVRLQNILFAGDKTLAYSKDAKAINELLTALREQDIRILMHPILKKIPGLQ